MSFFDGSSLESLGATFIDLDASSVGTYASYDASLGSQVRLRCVFSSGIALLLHAALHRRSRVKVHHQRRTNCTFSLSPPLSTVAASCFRQPQPQPSSCPLSSQKQQRRWRGRGRRVGGAEGGEGQSSSHPRPQRFANEQPG